MSVRTLVVDDDVAVAGLHQGFLLAHGGFEVIGLAHTGAQALELVAHRDPELILLDVYLPDMSGIEVLREIRAHHRRPVDVIAITAAREVETVRGAIAGGILHYLVKPFSSAVLHERLDDYLRLRAESARAQRSGELDQRGIDKLLGVSGAPPDAANGLPKGLSEPTLEAVAAALAAAGDASAAEVARVVGISRVTARRYLEHLVATGRARVQPRYGNSGRPEHRYRVGV